MVFINGGEFLMGADNNQAMRDEYPQHKVIVNSFLWMKQRLLMQISRNS